VLGYCGFGSSSRVAPVFTADGAPSDGSPPPSPPLPREVTGGGNGERTLGWLGFDAPPRRCDL
jgi:hypothetical protein